MNKLLIFFLVGFGISVHAARVAVVDSGTSFEHEHLVGKALINKAEIDNNRIDDDDNGKVDDVYGWSFGDNRGEIFTRDHLHYINPIVYPLFEVIARIQDKTASPKDEKFLQDNLLSLEGEERIEAIAELNYFGQYAHGTHVGGTVAFQSPSAEIMAVKVFPDSAPGFSLSPMAKEGGIKGRLYEFLAQFANGQFKQASAYINERNIDVANMSLGVPLALLAENFLRIAGNKNPTKEQIAAETQLLYSKYEVFGKEWLGLSPDTLFVIASGNDGQNNDVLPTFPSNVPMDNKISVGASKGYGGLAVFSNYGEISVDIVAPGVSEMSSVPDLENKKMLPMSGTSMAAPFIAGVAAELKDINPKLTPKELKTLLMETVDKKDWLKGKIKSAGVVNPKRAKYGAELTKTQSLTAAIEKARSAVVDIVEPVQPAVGTNSVIDNDIINFANQFVF